MPLLFLPGAALRFPRRRQSSGTCTRSVPRANINETRDSAREDEIAAKIASLRKMKRLQSQRTTSDGKETPGGAPDGQKNAQTIRSFDDLPDWKKGEVLQAQMAEAEAFMNPGGARTSSPSADSAGEKYKPKVSTWGVFPRPDNISRTFGGGKRIDPGGVNLDSEESKKQDAEVAKKLAAYRASRGIDSELEEAHREEIETTLQDAGRQMARARPYDAIKSLQAVEEYVSDQSRLGGQVFLSLALAYDAVGKRDEARELYSRLRRNPFPEVAGKAKQLLQGFEAMDLLKVDDDARNRGFRVTDFRLPDVTAGIEKRYETAVGSGEGQRSAPLDAGTSILLFLLVVGPIAFVLLVLGPASR